MSIARPERILTALSGGVDSAVAALLLQRQGHELEGVYLKTWAHEEEPLLGDCPWKKDVEDARAVAERLRIPFRVLNAIGPYRERVVDYLVEGYRQGITPNPDIMCNREIKFGLLLEVARREGFDAVATGHYCRRIRCADFPSGWRIAEGIDTNKDQSYFLALVESAAIGDARFPVGGLEKPQVRAIARQAGLPVADKKDSQGICFIGRIQINAFLEHYIPGRPGPIVDTSGRVLGEHQGLHRFTIGQRKGIGLPSNADHRFYVVLQKDYTANRLLVGFDSPEAPGLHLREVRLAGINWQSALPHPGSTLRLRGKPRYRDPSVELELELDPGTATAGRITIREPQRALAPGQVLALYDGETLLGGGVYDSVPQVVGADQKPLRGLVQTLPDRPTEDCA